MALHPVHSNNEHLNLTTFVAESSHVSYMTRHIVFVDEAAHTWFDLNEDTVVHHFCDDTLDDITSLIVLKAIMLWYLHTEFEPSFLQINREDADSNLFTVLNDIFHVGNIAPHLALVNKASDIGLD